MSEFTILISPDTYRGWKLSFCKSHDRQSDYHANNATGQFLAAPTLEELLQKIRDQQMVTKRLKKPLKALVVESHNASSFSRASIHTISGNHFIYRTANGETKSHHLGNLRLNDGSERHYRESAWIHDTPENRRILAEIKRLGRVMDDARAKQQRAERSLVPLTDADVRIAAKLEAPPVD